MQSGRLGRVRPTIYFHSCADDSAEASSVSIRGWNLGVNHWRLRGVPLKASCLRGASHFDWEIQLLRFGSGIIPWVSPLTAQFCFSDCRQLFCLQSMFYSDILRESRQQQTDIREAASLRLQRRMKQAVQFIHKDSADLLPLDGLKKLGTSKETVSDCLIFDKD